MFCRGCGAQVNPEAKFCKQCGAQLRGYQSAPQAGAKLATQGRQCRRRRASIESPAERGSTPTYSKSNNAPRSFWEQLRPSRFWLLLKTFFPIRSRHVVSDADVVQNPPTGDAGGADMLQAVIHNGETSLHLPPGRMYPSTAWSPGLRRLRVRSR